MQGDQLNDCFVIIKIIYLIMIQHFWLSELSYLWLNFHGNSQHEQVGSRIIMMVVGVEAKDYSKWWATKLFFKYKDILIESRPLWQYWWILQPNLPPWFTTSATILVNLAKFLLNLPKPASNFNNFIWSTQNSVRFLRHVREFLHNDFQIGLGSPTVRNKNWIKGNKSSSSSNLACFNGLSIKY